MVAAIAAQLADYTAGLSLGAVDPGVVRLAKLCVLDALGCMIGGHRVTPGEVCLSVAGEFGPGEMPVAGTDLRVPLAAALYINSYLANALDFDDTYEFLGHPGATIVPPALLVGAANGASGQQVLEAVIAGYEVSLRVGWAIRPSFERAQRVIGFSTWQVFGAAVAAGKLLGLGPEKLANMFGIAGASAPVPFVRKSGRRERPYAWVKNNYGWTALGGHLAATLANQGFLGNKTIFDGENGFWVMAGSDQCHFEDYTRGLGREWMLPDISFKPYPSCRHTHSVVDAALAAVAAAGHGGAGMAGGVRKVTVASDAAIARDFMVRRPGTIVDAQFSVPYVVAMVLLGREPGYAWLNEANLSDPVVQRTMDKVEAVVDETTLKDPATGRRATVTVDYGSDGSVARTVTVPRGDPGAPLAAGELERKFVSLVSPVLGAGKAQAIMDRVLALETLPVPALRELVHALATN